MPVDEGRRRRFVDDFGRRPRNDAALSHHARVLLQPEHAMRIVSRQVAIYQAIGDQQRFIGRRAHGADHPPGEVAK